MQAPSPVTSWTDITVTSMIRERFDGAASAATWIGSGAWSDCFAFTAQGRELVVRVGPQGGDFAVDAAVSRFATAQLQVPQVLVVGSLNAEHFCISERVLGGPLEQAPNGHELVQSTAHLLDALRTTAPLALPGWGRWAPQSGGQAPTWRSFLQAVDVDPVEARTHGWKTKLAAEREPLAAFEHGYARLVATIVDDVPRSLVHNDLVNRNVHVVGSEITGVFDWGNSIFGDHLYDIALMLFWQPWLPHLQARSILDAALGQWSNSGQAIANVDQRIRTCLIHIGLEHIAHNIARDDWVEAQAVIERMNEVADSAW